MRLPPGADPDGVSIVYLVMLRKLRSALLHSDGLLRGRLSFREVVQSKTAREAPDTPPVSRHSPRLHFDRHHHPPMFGRVWSL